MLHLYCQKIFDSCLTPSGMAVKLLLNFPYQGNYRSIVVQWLRFWNKSLKCFWAVLLLAFSQVIIWIREYLSIYCVVWWRFSCCIYSLAHINSVNLNKESSFTGNWQLVHKLNWGLCCDFYMWDNHSGCCHFCHDTAFINVE